MRSMNRPLSAITPMVMMATLPETLQDQVVQHLRKYLERCEYFVTTDDEILKHAKEVQGIVILDPPSLVREMNL